MERDNTQTINQWYRDKIPPPSAQHEHEFWERVFAYEAEDFVRDTIVRYDLGHILEQYINQRHRLFARELKTYPSCVQAHMDCWWLAVCTRKSPKCAQVLHNFFAQPNTPMASPGHRNRRVKEMLEAQLWDVALNSLSSDIAPETSWVLLEKIMANDGDWIQKNEWSAVVKKLSVYLSHGGPFSISDAKTAFATNHIFYTDWVCDIVWKNKYKTKRNKMLKQLFRLGVDFHECNFKSLSDGQATIQLIWNEYSKENLLKATADAGASPTKRKM